MSNTVQLHASCVSIAGKGVLLLGVSGSGKSDLALRLIDSGAILVADDRVDIASSPSPALAGEGRGGGSHALGMEACGTTPSLTLPPAGRGDMLIASPPASLSGKIESRGIGILTLPHQNETPLALAVALVGREEVERLPEGQFWGCLGLRLPLVSLYAFDASTPAKIRLYVQHGV